MKTLLLSLISTFMFESFLLLDTASAEIEYSQLPIKIERYTASTGEIDVRLFMENVAHFNGFRLVAVEVFAGALNERALMTVHIKNKRQGKSLQLGQFVSSYWVQPKANFYIGQGAEEIIVRTTKPAYVKYVNLILSY